MKAMLLISSFLLFSTAAFSDYESALEAYNRKDYATALNEARPSADQGDAKSQILLGWLYDSGNGVVEDDQTAMKWYRLAADQGEVIAQTNLGWLYESGNGADQDYKAALMWYRLAADQGFGRAQFRLGWMHEKGMGVEQNSGAAVKWYTLAAEQGYGDAQNNLGFMYANGKGVKRDRIHALMWWDIAAAQRVDKAAQNLYFLRKKMTPADIIRAERLARTCTAKKYKGCFPEEEATVCDESEDGSSLSVAAFVTLRWGNAIVTAPHTDVFDQFVSEARSSLKTYSIVKMEFQSKSLKEGETKAQHFKRKGCDSYLELSVIPTNLDAQVSSGGVFGERQNLLSMKIDGEMINTADDSTIWKDSYQVNCSFDLGTPLEQMESILEGPEADLNVKISECGRQVGKKFAGSLLKKL